MSNNILNETVYNNLLSLSEKFNLGEAFKEKLCNKLEQSCNKLIDSFLVLQNDDVGKVMYGKVLKLIETIETIYASKAKKLSDKLYTNFTKLGQELISNHLILSDDNVNKDVFGKVLCLAERLLEMNMNKHDAGGLFIDLFNKLFCNEGVKWNNEIFDMFNRMQKLIDKIEKINGAEAYRLYRHIVGEFDQQKTLMNNIVNGVDLDRGVDCVLNLGKRLLEVDEYYDVRDNYTNTHGYVIKLYSKLSLNLILSGQRLGYINEKVLSSGFDILNKYINRNDPYRIRAPETILFNLYFDVLNVFFNSIANARDISLDDIFNNILEPSLDVNKEIKDPDYIKSNYYNLVELFIKNCKVCNKGSTVNKNGQIVDKGSNVLSEDAKFIGKKGNIDLSFVLEKILSPGIELLGENNDLVAELCVDTCICAYKKYFKNNRTSKYVFESFMNKVFNMSIDALKSCDIKISNKLNKMS